MKPNARPGERQRRSAFTLVELLVVIAIIAILASLLTPVVQEALTKGKMTQTLSNGSQIHKVLYSRHMEGTPIFPSYGAINGYLNSTDFFKYCISERIIDADFSFFCASGLDAYSGLDAFKFRQENNAWCVVADVTEGTRNVSPFLFTRNLRLLDLSQPVDHPDAVKEDGVPFGTRGVVVIKKGGSGMIMRVPLDEEAFNPAEEVNMVLRPETIVGRY